MPGLRLRVVVLVDRSGHVFILEPMLPRRPLDSRMLDDAYVHDIVDHARVAISQDDSTLRIRAGTQQLPRIGLLVLGLERQVVLGPTRESQSKRTQHATSLERAAASSCRGGVAAEQRRWRSPRDHLRASFVRRP